jgi:hypothetical protein
LSGLESGWKMAGKWLAKWLAVFSQVVREWSLDERKRTRGGVLQNDA